MKVLSLMGQLAPIETRSDVARALAQELGVEDLLLFLRDPELGALLPAPGFTQTIRRGAEWRRFLAQCVECGECTGRMPSLRRDTEVDAWGYRIDPDGVLVLVGGTPDRTAVSEVLPLFPLVAAVARSEDAMRTLTARTRMATTAAAQSEMLARALERSRDQIRDALMDAREARHALQVTSADAESARAIAEEANRTKAGFLAMMSHELRTPLNAIGGYASLLEEGIMGPLVPGQREYLARIKRSQMHLSALINDVLDFAKAESATIAYQIEPLELRQVLTSVAPLIEPMAQSHEVAYAYDAPDSGVVVDADRDKVVQVVLNLLTNAVKFTPPHGRVSLRSELTANEALVTVTDSGPGIAAEHQASIFEPFVQLDRSFAQEREGVGLGLSISRELARGMKGDVKVQSVPGRGSTFILSLPRSKLDAESGAAALTVGREAPNRAEQRAPPAH